MRTARTTWAICAAMVAAGGLWPSRAAAAPKAEPGRTAAQLVNETLRREAKEGVDDRAELLKPAIDPARPNDAALWHSGFVYDSKRKEWLRWIEVEQAAAMDERLALYQQMREKYSDTVDSQLALARWCGKRKLEDQARAHFSRVLESDPDQADARQYLGFQLVHGAWVDDHDLAEARTRARKASAAAAEWIPQMDRLRERLASNNATQREKARAELMAISDPDAVDAIDAILCRQTGEMALLGIEALKDIRSRQTAAVLAWHAVFSPWPPVRHAAALALRLQEKYDYVPLLLNAAQMPAAPETQVAGSSDGITSQNNGERPRVRTVYRLDHNVNTYSWNTVEQLKEHPDWRQAPNMRFDPKSPNPVAKNTTDTTKQGGNTTTTKQREYYTVKDNKLQTRVTENKVTVDRQGRDSHADLCVSEAVADADEPRTDFRRARATTATRPRGRLRPASHWPRPPARTDPARRRNGGTGGTTTTRFTSRPAKGKDANRANAKLPGPAQRGDCLAAGTLVRTETGPVAIEKVAVGDRIFCCDPETGCLALKPVLRKTARPESRLVKIRAGGEEFEASGGHVFWVAGRGWVKARDLREGMHLHTLRGTVSVEATEPGTVQTTYSLVVDDFHTFFTGKGMVLTHDNTIRPPTDRIVPGLAEKVARAVAR